MSHDKPISKKPSAPGATCQIQAADPVRRRCSASRITARHAQLRFEVAALTMEIRLPEGRRVFAWSHAGGDH